MKANEIFQGPEESRKITIMAFIIGNAVALVAFVAPLVLYILAKEM
ncbi:hypothetical protein B0I27_102251 [Arcticibacter pallidicorallinus]|uniref:Uncharacterized protein n=1 Tax=Arcticibacter pallidicorallinus TaxID=1259464 RepID=A0A2T0U990_9SPHI|nr:hypothetical protein [Arcticibacter pallidicorallinus]PRY54484.1 hypothetical protein B0I27_102251 [Arcticibacter pallidicorallinus]